MTEIRGVREHSQNPRNPVKSRFNSPFRRESDSQAKKEMIQTELVKMQELAYPKPKEVKKKEENRRSSDKNLIDKAGIFGRAAALVTILGSGGMQQAAAGEQSASWRTPPPSPSSSHELPSQKAWNEQASFAKATEATVASKGDAFRSKEATIEVSKPITETYANLLVTEEWLKQNPQAIKAMFDVKDQDGKLLKKLAVVGKDLDPVNNVYGSMVLYEAPYDQTTQKISTEWKPVSKIPIENVLSMTALDNGRILYFGGETPARTTATDLRRSSDYGKSVGQNLWQSTSYSSVSGAIIDLIPINATTVYGNLGNSETGGMQIIIYDNLNTNTPNVQAIKTESISGTNLKSAGAPEITASYSLTNTIVVTSLASERLAPGVDVSSINYQDATGTTENFLGNRVGYVYGITEYEDSSGKHGLLADLDGTYTIFGYDVGPNGKPSQINYSINYARWLNNRNIPNYQSDSLFVYTLKALPDAQGNVHVWFFGSYTSDDNHAVIGHYIRGTNPNTDPNALFWKDIGPLDSSTSGPTQRKMQFKIVNEQPGFEYPVRSNRGASFGGIEFYPINRDFSPDPNAEIVRPNKGFQQTLLDILKRIFVPLVFKNLPGGSW